MLSVTLTRIDGNLCWIHSVIVIMHDATADGLISRSQRAGGPLSNAVMT
jgi:hypothetical protein